MNMLWANITPLYQKLESYVHDQSHTQNCLGMRRPALVWSRAPVECHAAMWPHLNIFFNRAIYTSENKLQLT